MLKKLSHVLNSWLGHSQVPPPAYAEVALPCPCCGYPTMMREEAWPDACQWHICSVCFWEDGDEYLGGGANHGINIAEARANYHQYGAMSPDLAKFTRPPTAAEKAGWVEPPNAQELMAATLARYEKVGGDILKFYCE